MEFRCGLVSTNATHERPREPRDGVPHIFSGKAQVTLKLGSSVGIDASKGKIVLTNKNSGFLRSLPASGGPRIIKTPERRYRIPSKRDEQHGASQNNRRNTCTKISRDIRKPCTVFLAMTCNSPENDEWELKPSS